MISIPYRANMTLLDAMIAVGGLSEYAAGNKARLIRFDKETGRQKELRCGWATCCARAKAGPTSC